MIAAYLAAGALGAPCAGVAPIPEEPRPTGATVSCVDLGIEAAARAWVEVPDAGVSKQLQLSRFRQSIGVWAPGPVGARLGVGAIRSGGESGYIGVAGESIVAQVQNAEVRAGWGAAGITGAAGLVDDPWIATGDDAWDLRAVAPTLGQEQVWVDPYDLGAWAAWTSPRRYATVHVAVLSGEGFTQRERNDGKDASLLLTVRPTAGGRHADLLELAAWARDGSRGLDSARNHRAAARVVARPGPVVAGGELLVGWGLDGDGERTPLGFDGFVRTAAPLPWVAWARFDWARVDRALPATQATVVRVGAGPRLPFGMGGAPLFLAAGYENAHYASLAAPIAGAGAAADYQAFLLEAAADIGGTLRFGPEP